MTVDASRQRRWTALWLVGVAGVVAPGVVLASAAHRSYTDLWYSVYVLLLVAAVHAVAWLALGALTWRWVGRRFVSVFSLGSWSALGGAVAAVTAMDHPYVYLAAYVGVAVLLTVGASVLAC